MESANIMKYITILLELIDNWRFKLFALVIMTFLGIVIGLSFPLLEKKVVDEGFLPHNLSVIATLVGAMFGLRVICGVLDIFVEKYRTVIKAELVLKLYTMVYDKICHIKYCFMQQNETELYNNIKQDIDNITLIVDDRVLNAVSRGIGMLGGIIGLFIISWKLALVTLILIPLKYLLSIYFSKKKKHAARNCNDYSAYFANTFSSVANAVREIRLYGLENLIKEDYVISKNKHTNADRNNDLINVYNMTCDGILLEFITCLIYFLGGMFLCNNEITLGDIFAFSMYSMHVIGPLTMLMNIKYVISGIVPSYERFQAFTAIDNELEINGLKPVCDDLVLECKKLSFKYENSGYNVISKLDTKLCLGDKVAIVGNNGSGKSTLLTLLLRFNNPTEGEIVLNNVNINDYNIKEYRKCFSVVNQQNYLFNKSIAYNICFRSEIDDKERTKIKDLLKKLKMDEIVIERCFEQNIGENGNNLSGGQRQKLALARALYKNAPILILDEIENNLDSEGREAFLKMIDLKMKDKLVVFITHDSEMLRYVNKVITVG